MSETTNISIRMEKDLKDQAEHLFNDLGMTMSTAFNVFVRQAVRQGKIPFEITMQSPEPSERLKVALKELEDVEKGKIKLKEYTNMDELIEALNEE